MTFRVWFDGEDWCAMSSSGHLAAGPTPVSAMINAEVKVRKDPRP